MYNVQPKTTKRVGFPVPYSLLVLKVAARRKLYMETVSGALGTVLRHNIQHHCYNIRTLSSTVSLFRRCLRQRLEPTHHSPAKVRLHI